MKFFYYLCITLLSKLEQAINLATECHLWQKRKDGADYITHPIAVMEILKEYDFPEDMLIAAVLHDICEDTCICSLDINKLFWTRVWFIVNALSKNKKPKNNEKLKKEYKEKENMKKISNLETYKDFDEYIDYRFHIYINRLYTWIIAEPWIFFIKVADQLHNLSDMKVFPFEKKKRKLEETENYFLPMYKKLKYIFEINPNSLERYNIFIKLLEDKVLETKNNYLF